MMEKSHKMKSEEDGKSDIRGFSLLDSFDEGSFLRPLSMFEHGIGNTLWIFFYF